MTIKKFEILINGRIAATWNGVKSKCRGCDQEIGWAVTDKNQKNMPFDLNCNCTSHFSTCPKANEFRKAK